MAAPNFLIKPHSLALCGCAGNLDDVRFVCVAERSDYISWIVNNEQQGDIRPESIDGVTYSSLPITGVVNGSTIVCEARGNDGSGTVKSAAVSFTICPCPIQQKTGTEPTASGAEGRLETTSSSGEDAYPYSSDCTIIYVVLTLLLIIAVVGLVVEPFIVERCISRKHSKRETNNEEMTAKTAVDGMLRTTSDGSDKDSRVAESDRSHVKIQSVESDGPQSSTDSTFRRRR